AIRLDQEQPVEADRAARIRTDRDADAAALGAAAALGRQRRLLRLPLEQVAALVERFPDEGAGHVGLLAVGQRGAERRVAGRGVDLADLDLVEPELLRRLRDDRLDDADALHAARRALRGLRR